MSVFNIVYSFTKLIIQKYYEQTSLSTMFSTKKQGTVFFDTISAMGNAETQPGTQSQQPETEVDPLQFTHSKDSDADAKMYQSIVDVSNTAQSQTKKVPIPMTKDNFKSLHSRKEHYKKIFREKESDFTKSLQKYVDLKKKFDEVKEEYDNQHQKAMQQKQEEYDKLYKLYSEVNKRYETDNANNEKTVSQLKADISEQQLALQRKDKELDQYKNKVVENETAMKAKSTSNSALERKWLVKLQENSDLLKETEDKMKTNETLYKMNLEKRSNEIKQLQDENEKRIMVLQGDVKNCKNEITDKDNEITALKEKLAQIENSGIGSDEKIKELSAEKTALSQRNEPIEEREGTIGDTI